MEEARHVAPEEVNCAGRGWARQREKAGQPVLEAQPGLRFAMARAAEE